MRGIFRVPMAVIAGALLGLIALLATFQYRWLGQISGAERERMTVTLNTRASAFAQDFDRELTRAYLLFQLTMSQDDEGIAAGVMARYDRWQATARFPRMRKHLGWYCKGFRQAAAMRARMVRACSTADVERIVDEYFAAECPVPPPSDRQTVPCV